MIVKDIILLYGKKCADEW